MYISIGNYSSLINYSTEKGNISIFKDIYSGIYYILKYIWTNMEICQQNTSSLIYLYRSKSNKETTK